MTDDWPDDSVPPYPCEGVVPPVPGAPYGPLGGPPGAPPGYADAPGAPGAPAGPYAPAAVEPKPLPADVPWLVRLSNLLGGFHNQFAWLWLGLTGVFLWVFVPGADVTGWLHFSGATATATGVVTASERTNCLENDVRVYKHTFRFTGPDGAERTGQSYATGRRLEPGSEVRVEYVPDAPLIARIRGMRRKPFGLGGLAGLAVSGMLMVFVGVGVTMLTVGVRKGLRANRLLASGRVALGRLTGRRPTATQINNRTVYEFTFAFTSDGQAHETKAAANSFCTTRPTRRTRCRWIPCRPRSA